MLEKIGKQSFSECKNHLEDVDEDENILLMKLLFTGGQGDK